MRFISITFLFFLSIAILANAQATHWYGYEEGMLAAGEFDNATEGNSLNVMKEAIEKSGHLYPI